MSVKKNKQFFKGLGNVNDSRKSKLAKQAIGAICGDTPDKETPPTKETTGDLHIKEREDLRNVLFTQLSSELKSFLEKIVEDAIAKIEASSSETASKIESVHGEIKEEFQLRKKLEDQLSSYSEKIACLEEQLEHQKDTFTKHENKHAICECCERTDVTMGMLVKIDSGQMICNNCLSELQS